MCSRWSTTKHLVIYLSMYIYGFCVLCIYSNYYSVFLALICCLCFGPSPFSLFLAVRRSKMPGVAAYRLCYNSRENYGGYSTNSRPILLWNLSTKSSWPVCSFYILFSLFKLKLCINIWISPNDLCACCYFACYITC